MVIFSSIYIFYLYLYANCKRNVHTKTSIMYRYTKDRISVFTWLDNRRAKKSGLFPVKVQVVYNRKQKNYLTGVDLSQEEYDKLGKAKSRKNIEIKESIENSFSLVRDNVRSLAEKGAFSFDALNARIGKANQSSVNISFQAKINMLTKEQRIGTRDCNVNALRAIELFDGENISFNDISIDWLKRFEMFLLKDKSVTTVAMYMRALRAIMNDARKAGIIKETQYPFGKEKFKIKESPGRKMALTLPQISLIFNYDDGTETSEKYRDFWIFLYLSNGMNVADMVKLKYRDIVDNEIYFVRQKTERTSNKKREIRIPLNEHINKIIERWGNAPDPDNYIFPYLTDKTNAEERKRITKALTKRINKRLELIGNKVGIPGIRTYSARHSFATVLKRSGAKMTFISESLGHADLKTTESYLDSFEKDEREKNALLLTNFEEESTNVDL